MKRITFLATTIGLLLMLIAGAAQAAVMVGTGGDNQILGTPRGDNIRAKGGNDVVDSLAKADFVFGNDGLDVLSGGDGSDLLNGGDGDDTIVGGDGEDELVGSRGDDTIYSGDDKLADEVQCGEGHDIVYVSGPDHQAGSLQRAKCEEIKSFKGIPPVDL